MSASNSKVCCFCQIFLNTTCLKKNHSKDPFSFYVNAKRSNCLNFCLQVFSKRDTQIIISNYFPWSFGPSLILTCENPQLSPLNRTSRRSVISNHFLDCHRLIYSDNSKCLLQEKEIKSIFPSFWKSLMQSGQKFCLSTHSRSASDVFSITHSLPSKRAVSVMVLLSFSQPISTF